MREGRFGRGGIAEMRVDEEIVRRFVVKLGRTRRERRFAVDDERQHLVIDAHRFGRIPGLGLGLGNDHRHRLAHMARALAGEQLMRADEDVARRAAARRGQLHVEFRRRHRIVRDRLEPIGADIGACEDTEHTRHATRFICVDTPNARMRMRRADEGGEDLARDMEIVGIAAVAGQQPEILFTRQWFSAVAQLEAVERIHQPSFIALSRPVPRPAAYRI